MSSVVLTDRPWSNASVEQQVIERAGLAFIDGSALSDAALQSVIPDAVGLLTCWRSVSSELIAAAPRLRVIARLGVGVDNIDLEAAASRNVTVTNVPDYCTEEVSDHTIALVYAWARQIVQLDQSVRAGRWEQQGSLATVTGSTLGVIGLGRIGQRVASKFAALGGRVLGYSRRAPQEFRAVKVVDLDTLLSEADVVSLHLPLTEATHHFVDATFYTRMKKDALLINTARGGLVDSIALAEALEHGVIGGAALDVLESEPEVPTRLASLSNVLFTPHVAFASPRSIVELRRRAAEEIVRVVGGQSPQHPVLNPAPGHD